MSVLPVQVNMNVETWRKELEDTVHRMQSAEEEKLHVIKQRDEVTFVHSNILAFVSNDTFLQSAAACGGM